MDATIRERTFRGATLDDVRDTAAASGALRGLLADGALKVTEGLTSVTEILRVAGSDLSTAEQETLTA